MSAVCRKCHSDAPLTIGLCNPCWDAEYAGAEKELQAARAPAPDESVVTRGDQIKTKRVRWAWAGYVPLGYLTIQSGESKLGKSTFAAWVISQITRGELPGQSYGTAADVLIVAVEDNLSDLWGPRLDAAGADRSRTAFLKAADDWNVRDGIELVRQAIREVKPLLVFVDAVMEHLPDAQGGESANSSTFVRRALRPLARTCDEMKVAGLISTHPPKGRTGAFADAYHGSGAFVQLSRSCLLFGWHPDDEEDIPSDERRRVMLRAAGNIGRDPGALSFLIGGQVVDLDDDEQAELGYVHAVEPCHVTARQLLTLDRGFSADVERPPDKTEEIREWLRTYLADGGWHPALSDAEIVEDLGGEQCSHGTIFNARDSIARARKTGSGWCWRLRSTDTAETNPSNSTDSLTLAASRAHTRDVIPTVDSSPQNTPNPPTDIEESKSQSSSTNELSDSPAADSQESRVKESTGPPRACAREADADWVGRTVAEMTDDELLQVFGDGAELDEPPANPGPDDEIPPEWLDARYEGRER